MCRMVQPGMVQYGVVYVQYGTARYGIVWSGLCTVWYSMVQYGVVYVPYGTVWCSLCAIWYSPVWYSMEWSMCRMVHGMVHGMVQHDPPYPTSRTLDPVAIRPITPISPIYKNYLA